MSDLLDIQERLLDTNAALGRLDRQLAEAGPQAPASLVLMGRSLRRRQETLEHEFLSATDELGIDVCSYRVFSEEHRPTIRGITSVLGSFVALVSVVYDSMKTSFPKERGRVGPETARETAFEWGYAFQGSVGVVLTLPNQRYLIGESHLDEAFKTIFAMAKAKEPADIKEHVQHLGAASVRAMYNWAHDHVDSGLGVDIEWRRERFVRASMRAPKYDLDELQQVINRTSDETTEDIVAEGYIVGVDANQRRFHMFLDTGREIRGTLAEVIDAKHTVTLPKRHRVYLVKRSKVYYSTQREEVSYFLTKLEELG